MAGSARSAIERAVAVLECFSRKEPVQANRGEDGAEERADAFSKAVDAVNVLLRLGDEQCAQIRAAARQSLEAREGDLERVPVLQQEVDAGQRDQDAGHCHQDEDWHAHLSVESFP